MTIALIVIMSLVLGMWIWRHFRLSQAMREDLRLTADPNAPVPDPAPLVSVLIPARNESANIGLCLDALLSQHYRNIEVLVVDDRSTDDTARLVSERALGDGRLRMLHTTELPAGWTGKNNAIWTGVQQARGDILLFLDADVTLDPGALAVMVNHFVEHRCDMLSMVLRLRNETFWEHTLQPVTGSMLVLRFPLSMVNNPSSKVAFGNGQVIMMRADTYREIGGHEKVKSELLEDMALARAVKHSGHRLHLAYGFDMAATRMYESLGSIWKGWSRIFYSGFQGKVWQLLIGVLLMVLFSLQPYLVLIPSAAWLLVYGASATPLTLFLLALAEVIMMKTAMARVYRVSRNDPRYILLHFPACLIALAILFSAISKAFSSKGIEWKGVRYATRRT
jgi:chlorobactene glucosyltransferase